VFAQSFLKASAFRDRGIRVLNDFVGLGHSWRRGLLAATALILAPCLVSAADLAIFAGNPWAGFYAGGHVGGIFSGNSSFSSDLSSMPSTGQTSVVGEEHISAHQFGPTSSGFDAGYNFVTPSGLLLGAEADFSFPSALRSNLQQNIAALGPSVVNDNVQIYGSLGGRIGYAFGDWLIYGTGGFTYDRDRVITTDYASGSADDNVYFWRPGWMAGAGAEVLLTENVSAKLEYAYYDFARAGIYLPVASEHYNSDLRFQTVRVGLNYHFYGDPAAQGTSDGVLPQQVRDNVSVHAQSTVVGQANAPFPAAYTGTNSLKPAWQTRDTFSVTGFLGYKEPFTGTEFYYNPEPFQGSGLAETHGIAGFPNIEAQKAGYDFPHYNTARLFLRHVFGLGGEQEDISDGPNQVAGKEDISRLTFTFGKLAIGDIFDNNSYSHDGRVGFMNWALVDAGAFNYSADQQGYTYGTVLDLNQKDWAVRAGYFLVPDVSNGENFDTRLFRRGQYIVEL
jgi:high affinity Mn2+ porin